MARSGCSSIRRIGLGIAVACATLLSTARAQSPPATFTSTISTGSQSVSVDFTLHPIRSVNFQVLVQQSDGSYLTHQADVPRTYLGTVQGVPGAIAIGLLRADNTLLAKVSFEDGKTWSTTGGTASASGSSFVPAWPTTVMGSGGAGASVHAAEVGIDSTFNHFTACGGNVDLVVEKCELSVISADMAFLRDAAIIHRIGKIIVRADAAQDPYAANGGDTGSLLPNLRTLWNTGNPMGSTHDVACVVHSGANGGLAYVGTIGTSSRYSANDSDGTGDFSVVWRHEVGHNWSSSHYEGGGNPEGSTIMSNNSLSRFSSSELLKIVAHRNTKTGILDNLGNYPFPLPPRANQDTAQFLRNTPVLIDVLANDSDSNGEVISLLSFDAVSDSGGTLTRSSGTGPGGRDRILYTPPADLAAGTDWFTYRIQDASGMQAPGYAMVRPRLELIQPVDRWKLDETSGSTATNSIRALNGTHESGALVNQLGANTVTRRGVYFDGSNDQTSIPAPGYNTNTLTFTTWIKRNGTQNTNSTFIFTRAGSSVSGFHFGISNELRYTWDGGGHTWNSGLVPPDNTWCLVAMCVSPSGTTLHLRTPSGLQSATNSATQAAEAFNGTMHLGWDPNSSSRRFKGWLDDVRVYTSTLTATDIESLYQQALVPPSITLTAPTAGSSVSPLNVAFSATVATQQELVDAVDFMDGETSLAQATSAPYQATVPAISPGGHTVTARASYGDWGYQVDSAPVSFTALPAPLPVITVSASLSASKLGPIPGSFTITRDHPIGSITVPLTIGGTGIAGNDYAALPTSVSLPAGTVSQTVVVNPIAAAPDGTSETVILTLVAGPDYTPGTPSTATLTIDDHITSVASSAWNVGTTWNSGIAAPVTGTQNSGEGYSVAHTVTSNNTGSNTQALVAGSLRIAAGGILDLARLHATTNQNVSYNLPATTVEDGGTIQFRCSVGSSTHTVAAAFAFSGNTTLRFNGGSYANEAKLTGQLSGSGTVAVVSDTNAGSTTGTIRQISVNSANNPFTGNWTVTHVNSGDDFGALRAGAARALGSGTVTVGTRSRLINDNATGLNSLTGVILNGASSLLDLNQPWNNPAAFLSLTGGSPVVELGNASSAIGNLTGSTGTIQGTGLLSKLTVNQTSDRSFGGVLGNSLTFVKSGTATLTLAGSLAADLRLELAVGGLRFDASAVTVGSLVQSGGNLLMPLPAPGTVPASIAGDYDWSNGDIILELPQSPPPTGIPFILISYAGTLTGTPSIPLPPEIHAEIDYGSGTDSQISITFIEVAELGVGTAPAIGGTASGAGTYEVGSYAPISASPASNWHFTGWTGTGIDNPSAKSTTVLINSAKTVTANFQKIDPFIAWIESKGLTGDDALKTADPDGDGMTNEIEFLFDFTPDDPNSRLKMDISLDAGGLPLLTINKVIPSGSFQIQWTSDLSLGWEGAVEVPVTQEALNHEVSLPSTPGRRFYRLRYTAP